MGPPNYILFRLNWSPEQYIFTLNLEMGAPDRAIYFYAKFEKWGPIIELNIFTLNLEMEVPEPYIFTLNLESGAPELYIFYAKLGNGGP